MLSSLAEIVVVAVSNECKRRSLTLLLRRRRVLRQRARRRRGLHGLTTQTLSKPRDLKSWKVAPSPMNVSVKASRHP